MIVKGIKCKLTKVKISEILKLLNSKVKVNKNNNKVNSKVNKKHGF